jgi:hypothetical protein
MAVTREEMLDCYKRPSFWQTLTVVDWLWSLLVLCGSGYVFMQYGAGMDVYELGIMAGVTAALIGTGWLWKPVRMLSVCVAALTLFALWRCGAMAACWPTARRISF